MICGDAQKTHNEKQAGFRRCAENFSVTNDSTTNSIRLKMAWQISDFRKVDPSVEDNKNFPSENGPTPNYKEGLPLTTKKIPISRCQISNFNGKKSGTIIFSKDKCAFGCIKRKKNFTREVKSNCCAVKIKFGILKKDTQSVRSGTEIPS